MTRERGFILTFVIMALIVVGIATFVLTDGANTMFFHADTAYLRAVERGLIASGLAWASEKVSAGRDVPIGEPGEVRHRPDGVLGAACELKSHDLAFRRDRTETACLALYPRKAWPVNRWTCDVKRRLSFREGGCRSRD